MGSLNTCLWYDANLLWTYENLLTAFLPDLKISEFDETKINPKIFD